MSRTSNGVCKLTLSHRMTKVLASFRKLFAVCNAIVGIAVFAPRVFKVCDDFEVMACDIHGLVFVASDIEV